MKLIQIIRNSSKSFWILFILAVALVLFFHAWQIDNLPRGLYVDESSIGLNAASITNNLTDEYGEVLPIYFKAFGEYKNPLYIYAASLLFYVFGISELVLRATSFLFFASFLIGFIVLTRQLFPNNKLILVYTLLSAGFLPWIFAISRVSFEVISQPAVFVWVIYFFVRAYAKTSTSQYREIYALITGAIIGLSVYTYSTSRVLSFAVLGLILLIYYRRQYWRRHLNVLLGFTAILIPYITFSIVNPGALTHRFNSLTYIFNPDLSILDKASIFITTYFSYLDLNFLLFSGDPNLRHHTGFGGEVFIGVFILFVMGVWETSARLTQVNSDKRLIIFILLGLVITPLSAALTEPYHSLRSVMLGFYILLLSVYGFSIFQQFRRYHLRYILPITMIIVVLIESVLYVSHYFIVFPSQSIAAFESYDFKSTLTSAVAQNPDQIIVTNRANAPYAHAEFYSILVDNPRNIPILIGDPIATPNTCIITFNLDSTVHNTDRLPITSISAHSLKSAPPYTNLTCY